MSAVISYAVYPYAPGSMTALTKSGEALTRGSAKSGSSPIVKTPPYPVLDSSRDIARAKNGAVSVSVSNIVFMMEDEATWLFGLSAKGFVPVYAVVSKLYDRPT